MTIDNVELIIKVKIVLSQIPQRKADYKKMKSAKPRIKTRTRITSYTRKSSDDRDKEFFMVKTKKKESAKIGI